MIIHAADRKTTLATCPTCGNETRFHDPSPAGLCRSAYCSDTCVSHVLETVWASKNYWVRTEVNEWGCLRIAEWRPLEDMV